MTFATRQRFLLGLAVLMMLAPTFLYAGGYLAQAPMFEGDRRQEMTCITCDGLGNQKGESCKTCRGRGVADYILPGPHRPLQLVGTVNDAKSKPLTGAEIEISEKGQEGLDPIVMKTNDSGQFGFKFPPGSYHLKFKHGQHQAERDLTVEANQQPIAANIGGETLHKIEQQFTIP